MKVISVDCRMVNSSGIGTYLKNTLLHLISTNSKFFFNLIGQVSELESLRFSNCNLIKSNAAIYSLREQIQILRKIPNSSDLFWSPHINIPFFYFGKLLVTVHDLYFLAMRKYIQGIKKKTYAKIIFPLLRKKARAFICVSEYTANELQLLAKVESNRIHIIPNGLSASWFNIEKQDSFYPRPYFLYVGNVKPHKNLLNLLKAFKLIYTKIPHQLVIVGKKDGFLTEDPATLNEAKRFSDRVVFTGSIGEETLKQFYTSAE